MRDINSIKELINKDSFQKIISSNTDAYGSACINVAINVMKYLDDFDGEFNVGYYPDITTAHGINCKCDDQWGITGFMAGVVRNIVANHHKLGWKFYLSEVLNKHNIGNVEYVDKVIKSTVGLVSLKEAKYYADVLIKRYNDSISKGNNSA